MRSTYEELVVLGGLDGAVLGEALDDLGGLVELGFGHGGWSLEKMVVMTAS